MLNNVTVLVQSCDKYEDLWPVFFEVFKKQWPDCPYNIVLNTETKSFSYSGLNITSFNIYKGKTEEEINAVSWSERYMETLKRIDTKYVFVILDDFFIHEKVNTKGFYDLVCKVDKIKNFGAVYCNFNNTPTFYNKRLDMYYIHHDTMSRVNSVCGLWNKDELKKTLIKGETPWTYEPNATIRYKAKKNIRFFAVNNETTPLKLDFHEQIVKGKWSYECKNLLEKLGINIDFSVRGVLPPWEVQNNKSTPKSFNGKFINFTLKNYYLYNFFWYLRKFYRTIKRGKHI